MIYVIFIDFFQQSSHLDDMDANDNNKHCSGDWSDDDCGKPTKRIKQEFDSYNDYMVGPNRNSQYHQHPTPMNQLTPPHPSSYGPRGMPPGMTSTATPRTATEENTYEGIDSARQWSKQTDVKPGHSKFTFLTALVFFC